LNTKQANTLETGELLCDITKGIDHFATGKWARTRAIILANPFDAATYPATLNSPSERPAFRPNPLVLVEGRGQRAERQATALPRINADQHRSQRTQESREIRQIMRLSA
jgi:hypothetical protein